MTEQELAQKRLAFLEDTVAYYSADPKRRAVISEEEDNLNCNCFYRHPEDGRPCAIGRYIPDDVYEASFEGNTVTGIFTKLPVDMQLLGMGFLDRVQHLHDTDQFWNNTGLSSKGISYVDFIKQHYNL